MNLILVEYNDLWSRDQVIGNRLRQEVQSIIQGWLANLPAIRSVRWVSSVCELEVTTDDCLVYFVHSYESGAKQKLQESLRDQNLSAESRRELEALEHNYSNQARQIPPPELGLTIPAEHGESATSEVWTRGVIQYVFGIHARDPGWSDGTIHRVAAYLAQLALHEAMHNRIDSHLPGSARRDEQWLHHQRGVIGASAAGLSNSGEVIGPNEIDQHLIGQYFNRPTRQYLIRSQCPSASAVPPGPM